MKMYPQNFWRNQKNIVLFGLTRRPGTISHQVRDLLVEKGYAVFPVNPHAEVIENIKCYSRLEQISEKPDAAVIITNPRVSGEIVRECAARGIRRLWFQYDTLDAPVEALCQENGMNYIYDCVLKYPDCL